jgi:hypothetical protein
VVEIQSVWASPEGAIATQELLYTQPCPSYS